VHHAKGLISQCGVGSGGCIRRCQSEVGSALAELFAACSLGVFRMFLARAPKTTRGGACAPRGQSGLFPGVCSLNEAALSMHVIVFHAGGTIGREVARGKDEFIRLLTTRVITR
jgi:hypothetical protein